MDSQNSSHSRGGAVRGSAGYEMLGIKLHGTVDKTEEFPPMRAVALSSGQVLPLRFSSSIVGPKVGKAPPLGIARPSSVKVRSASAGIAVKQEWNESNWKVSDLEQVPLDFPLERTHREIIGIDASEVAKRISNTLRILSVQAEYDGENAKAKCTTTDMVSFRIRLFAGGEDGLPVVVEVQRRNGSPSSFMRVCRQILDGAEGAEIKIETATSRKKMPPFMKGPVGGMNCLESAVKSNPEADLNNGLQKSMDLLRSKHKDANVLGLENLCLLTNPLKTRPDIALNACKAIILDPKCAEVREEVGVTLQKDAFLDEEFDDDAGRNLIEKSRHLALVLLSNALHLTSKDGSLAAAVKSEKWFGDFLIPTLLDEVKGFETGANNAYEAACGLSGLAACSDVARKFMEENSAVDDLNAAYKYGLHNHELLANECERTLSAIGKSIG